MKLPPWLLKYIKEPTFQIMTAAILVGSLLFQMGMCIYDGYHPIAFYLAWPFYFLIILPICYWQRNTK